MTSAAIVTEALAASYVRLNSEQRAVARHHRRLFRREYLRTLSDFYSAILVDEERAALAEIEKKQH